MSDNVIKTIQAARVGSTTACYRTKCGDSNVGARKGVYSLCPVHWALFYAIYMLYAFPPLRLMPHSWRSDENSCRSFW